jgi:hypothetical protein
VVYKKAERPHDFNEMKKETTAQIIFRKHSELNKEDFLDWLIFSRKDLLSSNKLDIKTAHASGAMRTMSNDDYYDKNYDDFIDNTLIMKAWIHDKWYRRLYYKGEMIGNFISFDEAMEYAKINYDRATDTIKKN